MPAIIPIPAFSDNYIWLLRKGSFAAVVDPDDITVPGTGCTLRVLDVPGHAAGHIAYVDDVDGAMECVRRRYARLRRLRAPVRGQTGADGGIARQARFPGLATRVYCAYEYTLANLRFPAAVEPANPDLGPRIGRSGGRIRDVARVEERIPLIRAAIDAGASPRLPSPGFVRDPVAAR